jgi:hypothetical protein
MTKSNQIDSWVSFIRNPIISEATNEREFIATKAIMRCVSESTESGSNMRTSSEVMREVAYAMYNAGAASNNVKNERIQNGKRNTDARIRRIKRGVVRSADW